jgi:hypothetical protein
MVRTRVSSGLPGKQTSGSPHGSHRRLPLDHSTLGLPHHSLHYLNCRKLFMIQFTGGELTNLASNLGHYPSPLAVVQLRPGRLDISRFHVRSGVPFLQRSCRRFSFLIYTGSALTAAAWRLLVAPCWRFRSHLRPYSLGDSQNTQLDI